MSFRTRAAAAALAFSLSVPMAAHADDEVTTSVPVKRIAVNSPADQRRLERRLGDAALTVCGAEDHDLSEHRDAVRRSACYAKTMAAARISAGIPDAGRSEIASAAPDSASGRP